MYLLDEPIDQSQSINDSIALILPDILTSMSIPIVRFSKHDSVTISCFSLFVDCTQASEFLESGGD